MFECRADKANNFLKFTIVVVLTGSMLILPVISSAQDLPCDGEDPFATCPIDSCIWILIIPAMFLGAFYTYRNIKIQAL